jgi:transglutaminase-like putative cysteine protease
MPLFKIQHITKYEYDRPVAENVNEIKIFPFQCPEQETLQFDLNITGHPEVETFHDYWGNKIGSFNILNPHTELIIESKSLVRTTSPSELGITFQSSWDQLEADKKNNLKLLELTSKEVIKHSFEIDNIIKLFYKPDISIAGFIENLSEYIFKNYEYIKGITNIETTVDEILQQHAGVCQDFVHLMLQLLRAQRVPCRYVSGYICPNKNGMRGQGATHAWLEAWVPGYGWAGIDPTNNTWITNTHVKLAIGRNFQDCSPVKGSFKGPANQKLSIYVSVGYEDGHIFEDINNVKMTEEPPIHPDDISESPMSQQQQ